MSRFDVEAPQKSFLKSAFDAVARRAMWTVLGAGALAGGGLATLEDNSNLCVSYQTPKGSRNFCVGVSAVFDSAAQNAPTTGASPMTGDELENFLTSPAKPGTAPAVPAIPSIPPSEQEKNKLPGTPENPPMTPEKQAMVNKVIEWFEDPCNPDGFFQMEAQINQLVQRPAPTCT